MMDGFSISIFSSPLSNTTATPSKMLFEINKNSEYILCFKQ